MPDVTRTAPDKTHTQSVVFDKQFFTRSESNKWCKDHDYFTDGMDETATQFRYRQYQPDDSKFSYRSFNKGLPKGISFILGYLK